MSIPLISEIVPKNNGAFAMLDDTNLRGGSRIVNTLNERNAIPVDKRKNGMLVFVIETDIWYSLQADLLTWVYNSKVRFNLDFTSPVIDSGDVWDFEIPLSSQVALLLQLSVSVPCCIEIHGAPERVDTNPFKFIGIVTHLSDDGSTIMSDGSVIDGRRYSILANMENPLRKYAFGRVINNGAIAQAVSITLELLSQ